MPKSNSIAWLTVSGHAKYTLSQDMLTKVVIRVRFVKKSEMFDDLFIIYLFLYENNSE